MRYPLDDRVLFDAAVHAEDPAGRQCAQRQESVGVQALMVPLYGGVYMSIR
ncbi:hypothetical protein [Natronorubrum tibetense]|uniref:hypothetical protein n=1 Tax=Natronorubrum tibetense TaxID=63128 RepID=UPI000B24C7AD|nr:hypothetical protein [Natronorubrum tibetense]